MERSELISKLCKEAAETTPDVYNNILKAAKAQGLISGGGAGAGLSGGGATANGVGGSTVKAVAGAAVKSRFAAVAATVMAAVIATTAVAVPLALNANNSELGGGSEIEAPDVNGGTQNPSTPDTPDSSETPSVPDTDTTNSDRLKYNFITENAYGLAVIGFESCDVPVDVVIPSKYKGFPVVAIAEGAFMYDTLVSSVALPSTITNIRRGAFNSCASLTKVTAYSGDYSVADGNAPITYYAGYESETPNTVEEYAFANCDNLESVELPEIEEEPQYGWSSCYDMYECISKIEQYAFYNCPKLETIILPNSICFDNSDASYSDTYVPIMARCYNLKTLNVPIGLQMLPNEFIMDCPVLENIIIPEGITTLFCQPLAGTSVKELYIPASVAFIYNISQIKELEKITVSPDSERFLVIKNSLVQRDVVMTQGTVYVATWYTVKRVLKGGDVPDSDDVPSDGILYSIDGYALEGFELENFAVPEVQRLEHFALYGCKGLKEVVLPLSLKYIGSNVFGGAVSADIWIGYNGTVAQWNAISKDDTWNNGKNYIIHCSDGTVNV